MASVWAKGGGFIDFETYDFYVGQGVFVYWGSANALSMFVMSAGLAYIVHEYCTQSHFSSKYTAIYIRSVPPNSLTRSGALYPCNEGSQTHKVVQKTYMDSQNRPRPLCWMGQAGLV